MTLTLFKLRGFVTSEFASKTGPGVLDPRLAGARSCGGYESGGVGSDSDALSARPPISAAAVKRAIGDGSAGCGARNLRRSSSDSRSRSDRRLPKTLVYWQTDRRSTSYLRLCSRLKGSETTQLALTLRHRVHGWSGSR